MKKHIVLLKWIENYTIYSLVAFIPFLAIDAISAFF